MFLEVLIEQYVFNCWQSYWLDFSSTRLFSLPDRDPRQKLRGQSNGDLHRKLLQRISYKAPKDIKVGLRFKRNIITLGTYFLVVDCRA